MTIGPDPMTRIVSNPRAAARQSLPPLSAPGAPGRLPHQSIELAEEVPGIVRARAPPRGGTAPRRRRPGAADPLDHTVVEVDMGHLGVGHRAGGHGVVVVLAGDLHHARSPAAAPGGWPRGARTGACRWSRPARRRAAGGPGRSRRWGPRPSRSAMVSARPGEGGGVARARWRGTPRRARVRGRRRPRSPAGTTVTVARAASWRTMVALTPKSKATIAQRAVAARGRRRGVTAETRSHPVGARRPRRPRRRAASPAVPKAQGTAPTWRRWRVRRRVSTPVSPGGRGGRRSSRDPRWRASWRGQP